jgi:hypothetical protein
MPYLSGSGTEWVDPPLGEQPVEVKKAQLYQLNLSMLTDPVSGYNQNVDGFPPPLEKCTTLSKAVGWRLSFGIYGDAEETWKARHDGDVQVSWAGTYTVTGIPYAAEQDKFYVTWERYVAPVLGGMADGALREFVKAMGKNPAPDFFSRIFKGMRCVVDIVQSPGDNIMFHNVAYTGPAPAISSDPTQADHNLALLKDRLRIEKAALGKQQKTQVTTAVIDQIMGVFTALKDAGLKNDAALKADCWQVSQGQVEFVDELDSAGAELLLIGYTSLWEEFENSGETAEAGSGPASIATKKQLEALFKEVTTGKSLTTDAALAHVVAVLGDNAEERKEAAGGFYMNALTEKEALEVIQRYLRSLEEVPF